MRVLAFDIGDKRVGIAYGDTKSKIASPISVLDLNEVLSKSKNFQLILDDYQPEFFVFGLPKSLSGQASKQTEHVQDLAKQISSLYSKEFDFVDERLSSAEAKNILRQQGYSEKQMRGKLDSLAASIFLQTWFSINEGDK